MLFAYSLLVFNALYLTLFYIIFENLIMEIQPLPRQRYYCIHWFNMLSKYNIIHLWFIYPFLYLLFYVSWHFITKI